MAELWKKDPNHPSLFDSLVKIDKNDKASFRRTFVATN